MVIEHDRGAAGLSKQTLTHVLTGVHAGCDKRQFLDAVREQSVPRDNVPSSIRPSRDRSATLRPSWHARKVQKIFIPGGGRQARW